MQSSCHYQWALGEKACLTQHTDITVNKIENTSSCITSFICICNECKSNVTTKSESKGSEWDQPPMREYTLFDHFKHNMSRKNDACAVIMNCLCAVKVLLNYSDLAKQTNKKTNHNTLLSALRIHHPSSYVIFDISYFNVFMKVKLAYFNHLKHNVNFSTAYPSGDYSQSIETPNVIIHRCANLSQTCTIIIWIIWVILWLHRLVSPHLSCHILGICPSFLGSISDNDSVWSFRRDDWWYCYHQGQWSMFVAPS